MAALSVVTVLSLGQQEQQYLVVTVGLLVTALGLASQQLVTVLVVVTVVGAVLQQESV